MSEDKLKDLLEQAEVLIREATPIVELFPMNAPTLRRWKDDWLNRAVEFRVEYEETKK